MNNEKKIEGCGLSGHVLMQRLFPLICSPKGGARKFKNLIAEASLASMSMDYELTVYWDIGKPNRGLIDALTHKVKAWVSDDFDVLGLKLEFRYLASYGYFVIGCPNVILSKASEHYARISANLYIVLEFINALYNFCANVFVEKYPPEGLSEEELAEVLEGEIKSMKADIPDKPFDARFKECRKFERAFWA